MNEFRKQSALATGFNYEQQLSSFLPAPFSFNIDKLSEKELRVAELVLRGYTYTDIAEALNIQPNTVKTHQKKIYSKLHINSKRELFALVETRGL